MSQNLNDMSNNIEELAQSISQLTLETGAIFAEEFSKSLNVQGFTYPERDPGFEAPPHVKDLVLRASKLKASGCLSLTARIKQILNVPDAPVFATGGAASGGAVEAEKEEAPSKFMLVLMAHGEKKTDAIKALKTIYKQALNQDLNIVELRNKLEVLPLEVLKDLPKDKADEYLKLLVEAGCKCELKAG